jgi:hypothetical protein
MTPLSVEYERTFEHMLGTVASAVSDPEVPLVPFWPLCGASFDRELMVMGRSVNGWVEDWTARQLRDPTTRALAAAAMRRDAEPDGRDRMAWVTDLWGATSGYNTKRSAFWRAIRRVVDPHLAITDWPSRIAWTNLYKVSPAAGWNPGTNLQRAQRSLATELLNMEIKALAPQRVLAFTGEWIEPFVSGLGLKLTRRQGLVEGLGTDDQRAWVVAKHPMGKPGEQLVAEVRSAFSELGASVEGDDGRSTRE